MSWNNGGQPRRSAPLINRPTAAAPPPAAPPSTFSGLGGAIAGALGGMGYAQPQSGAWAQGGGLPYGAPAGAGGYPPSSAPPYGGGGRGGYGQPPAVGAYGPPQHYGQHGWNGQPHGYPTQPPPQSAYPPSFYPPSHHLRQPLPPAPAPYASTSSMPYPSSLPPRPQTTEDGYTLSAAYDPSSASSSSFPPGAPSRGGPSSGKRGRGGARGGGGGGGGRQPNQGPQLINCSQEGCSFRGRSREVREHEEDRHLIYQPGREPKPWSGSLKPLDGAVIEGTGISLDTPEALAKWIEERKKRWPSKKVVEEKEKAREQRIAAGLEAPPRERGGRGRGRGHGQSDFGGGRGRGQGRGGGRGGYGGTRDAGYGARGEEEGERAAKRFKGEEGKVEGEVSSLDESDSDSSSDSSSDSDSDSDDDDDDDDSSDDGPPEEESTAKAGLAGEDGDADDGPEEESVKGEELDAKEIEEKPRKQFQVVCRHWRKGQCQLGDEKCPYLHEIPANAPPPPPPKRKRPAPPPPAHNPFARPASFSSDPFALLAERDHRHIVSDVLQVIEWLGANDWLRGVEIRPGQVDEESGIEVLGETKAEEEGGNAGIEEVEMVEGLQEKDGEVAPSSETTTNPDAAAPSPAPFSAPVPSSLPEKLSSVVPASTPAPSSAIPASTPPAPALAPAAASSAAPPASGLAFLADYGSDSEDDEEAEAAVAASLVGKA